MKYPGAMDRRELLRRCLAGGSAGIGCHLTTVSSSGAGVRCGRARLGTGFAAGTCCAKFSHGAGVVFDGAVITARCGDRLDVELTWQAAKGQLGFRFSSETGVHASGRLRFQSGQGA